MIRILVTGNAGAGKTTVSNHLGNLLQVPVYGLDKIVWCSHWKQTSASYRATALGKIITKDHWIIDGLCSKAAKAADIIIFLDMPRHICYWRSFKRNIRFLFKSRPDLPPKCPEILILAYLIKLIWKFPRLVRPVLLEQLIRLRNNKTIIYIRNQQQLKELLTIVAQHNDLKNDLQYNFT